MSSYDLLIASLAPANAKRPRLALEGESGGGEEGDRVGRGEGESSEEEEVESGEEGEEEEEEEEGESGEQEEGEEEEEEGESGEEEEEEEEGESGEEEEEGERGEEEEEEGESGEKWEGPCGKGDGACVTVNGSFTGATAEKGKLRGSDEESEPGESDPLT